MYWASICAACSGVGCGALAAVSFLPQPQSAQAHSAGRKKSCFIGRVADHGTAAADPRLGKWRASSRGIVIVRIVARQFRTEPLGMAVCKVHVASLVVAQRDQVARRHKPPVIDETGAAVGAVDAFVGLV